MQLQAEPSLTLETGRYTPTSILHLFGYLI